MSCINQRKSDKGSLGYSAGYSFRDEAKLMSIFLSIRIIDTTKITLKYWHNLGNKSWKGAMNKKLILYGDEVSPPVRFVLMTANMLEISLNFHNIELFKEENKSSFFKKINRLQKVPALQIDDDDVICDSHAIALYLCHIRDSQHLYPEDPLTRARVNQILFFNSGTLFPIDSVIFTDYFGGKRPADEIKVQQWYSAIDHLEYQLTNRMWLASDKVSLADLCCVTTVSSLQLLIPLLDRHLKLRQWLDRMQKLPCYKINSRGLDRLNRFLNSF